MSETSRMAKIKKPRGAKVAPLSEQSTNVPVEVGRVDVPSHMGRTRTGTQHSPEVWGNRIFGKGDRRHPNAKPEC
jgi:hypothetical protein